MPYNTSNKVEREQLVLNQLSIKPKTKLREMVEITKIPESTLNRVEAWINRKQPELSLVNNTDLHNSNQVISKLLAQNPLYSKKQLSIILGVPVQKISNLEAWKNRTLTNQVSEVKTIIETPLVTIEVAIKPKTKISIFVDSANIVMTAKESEKDSWSIKLLALLKKYVDKYGSDCQIYYYVSVNHTLANVYNELLDMGVKIIFTYTKVIEAYAPNSDYPQWHIVYAGNCDPYIIADMPLIAVNSSQVILLSNDTDYIRVMQNILNSPACSCDIKLVHSQTLAQQWNKVDKKDRLSFIAFANESDYISY